MSQIGQHDPLLEVTKRQTCIKYSSSGLYYQLLEVTKQQMCMKYCSSVVLQLQGSCLGHATDLLEAGQWPSWKQRLIYPQVYMVANNSA